MPSTALTVLQAERDGIRNFSVFCNHITIVPTIKAILDSPDLHLDGFLGPGHVAMVIGTAPLRIHRALLSKADGRRRVRAARRPAIDLDGAEADRRGALRDRKPICPHRPRSRQYAGACGRSSQVYELREFFEWRGLGSIDHSGVRIRAGLRPVRRRAEIRHPELKIADPKSCQCGEVLKGVIKPWQCKVFGTACTPETPLGALMVSSEGACAAYYQYGGIRRGRTRRERRAPAARPPPARPAQCAEGDARPWRRRQGDEGSDRRRLRARLRQPGPRAAGGPGALRSRPIWPRAATGSPSPPTPMSSTRCSSPAATSASSRCAARSTTSRSAVRCRSICPARSSSRRGSPVDLLRRVARSMAGAAREAGVEIVTGDTKVVDEGACDQLFITTAGIGVIRPGLSNWAPGGREPGDAFWSTACSAITGRRSSARAATWRWRRRSRATARRCTG